MIFLAGLEMGRFWARFGRDLGEFWASSGRVLGEKFYQKMARNGPDQGEIRAGSGREMGEKRVCVALKVGDPSLISDQFTN